MWELLVNDKIQMNPRGFLDQQYKIRIIYILLYIADQTCLKLMIIKKNGPINI